MKTYEAALKSARKVGAARAQGDDHVAQMVDTLCRIHPSCNPRLVYEGAIKKGLSVKVLATLANTDPLGFSDLMFFEVDS